METRDTVEALMHSVAVGFDRLKSNPDGLNEAKVQLMLLEALIWGVIEDRVET